MIYKLHILISLGVVIKLGLLFCAAAFFFSIKLSVEKIIVIETINAL